MISLIGFTMAVNLYFVLMKVFDIVFMIFKMIFVNRGDLFYKFKQVLYKKGIISHYKLKEENEKETKIHIE